MKKILILGIIFTLILFFSISVNAEKLFENEYEESIEDNLIDISRLEPYYDYLYIFLFVLILITIGLIIVVI